MIKNKKKSSKKDMSSVVRLGKYVFRYWYLFIFAVILTVLDNQFGLMGPKYSGEAIDAVAGSAGVNFEIVYDCLKKMIFCYNG